MLNFFCIILKMKLGFFQSLSPFRLTILTMIKGGSIMQKWKSILIASSTLLFLAACGMEPADDTESLDDPVENMEETVDDIEEEVDELDEEK